MSLLTATVQTTLAWLAGIVPALAYAITLTVTWRRWRGACRYIPTGAIEPGRKAT